MSYYKNYIKLIVWALLNISLVHAQQIEIKDNHGNIQQNNGNKNINIGTVNGGVIIQNRPVIKRSVPIYYYIIKIEANTKSNIYLDGKNMGIAEVEKPLILKLHKGQFKIIAKSCFYTGYELENINVIDKTEIGIEGYLDFTFDVSNDLIAVRSYKNGKYGFLNMRTGELAIRMKYDEANDFTMVLHGYMLGRKRI